MYVCLKCEYLFEEPKSWFEIHGEKYVGCPNCGSDFTETFRCDDCMRFVLDEYIELNDGQRFCPDCTSKKKLKDF